MKKILDDDAFYAELTSLFLSEGMSALTVGDIAARMRCSRRRLYEHAQTKEELFCQVVQRHFDTALKAGNAVLERADRDIAETLAEYLRVGARAGAGLSTAFLTDLEKLPEAKKIFDDYQNARAASAQDLIEHGIRQGFFVPCHALLVTEVMRAAALRLRQPEFQARAKLTMDQAFDEFYRVLLGGLLEKRVTGTQAGDKARRGRPART
jgi:AcrR family transcriptional regulator